MKKKLVVLLSVIFVLSLSIVYAKTYTDIEGNQYENAIEDLSHMDIISGYEDGTYRPNNSISRAEMAKLIIVFKGFEKDANELKGTTRYLDVSSTHWATGFIELASQYGYIEGDGIGGYRPDDTVTYSEAITIIIRALGYSEVEDSGKWPDNYISKGNELEIFNGISKQSNDTPANRGAIAQMLYNSKNKQNTQISEEFEDILDTTRNQIDALEIVSHNSMFWCTSLEITSKGQVIKLVNDIKELNRVNYNKTGKYFTKMHVYLTYKLISDSTELDANGTPLYEGCNEAIKATNENNNSRYRVYVTKTNEEGAIVNILVIPENGELTVEQEKNVRMERVKQKVAESRKNRERFTDEVINEHNNQFNVYANMERMTRNETYQLATTVIISNLNNSYSDSTYYGEYHVYLTFDGVTDAKDYAEELTQEGTNKLLNSVLINQEIPYYKAKITKISPLGIITEIEITPLEDTIDYIILYKGSQITASPDVKWIKYNKLNQENIKKLNTTYYNYADGKYTNSTMGVFNESTTEFSGVASVRNVGEFAMSKKYNAIPRKVNAVNNIETKNSQLFAGITRTETISVDLDGDGKLEYIVCAIVDTKGENMKAASTFVLLNSQYQMVDILMYLENGFVYGIKEEENKYFMSIDRVKCIDLDNDGIMEIVIDVPTYEGQRISVYKYKDGKVQGEKSMATSLLP